MSVTDHGDKNPEVGNGATVAPEPSRHRHWWNWLTMLGLLIALCGFAVGLFLLMVEFRSEDSNIYLSIITFAVVPTMIGIGVGIGVLGFVIQVMHVKRTGERSILWFDPRKQRRWLPLYAVILIVFLVASTYGSYRTVLFAESREFCGEICHTVMHPEFIAHSNSPHARVDCTQCHTGPGITHHVRDKLRGMHQLVAITTGNFNRPIATPLEHLRPAHEICEQCHWPEKFIGTILQKHDYFLPDEENTHVQTALHVHVGGGELDVLSTEDAQPSIHWHVTSPSKVYYMASDSQRQDIIWVKLVDAHGREVTYTKEDIGMTEAELVATHKVHEMDCIDCHNRSVHQFKPPQRLLNSAMLQGKVDRSLPFIKREGLRVLKEKYTDREEAKEAIAVSLHDFYKEEYPDLFAEREPAIRASATAIGELFDNNIFPTMMVDWKTHPDNIGHTFFKGCFRCHGGNMKSSEGKAISHRCETCHDIVAQSRGNEPLRLTEPQEFVHPEDIMELWKESLCTDCHDGGGASF